MTGQITVSMNDFKIVKNFEEGRKLAASGFPEHMIIVRNGNSVGFFSVESEKYRIY